MTFDLIIYVAQKKGDPRYSALMRMVRKNLILNCIDFVVFCREGVGVLFTSCGCEALAITLARAELRPATLSNPRCALSFSLLDRADGLLVESQVSLKDFCNSLSYHWHFQNSRYKQCTTCTVCRITKEGK